MQVKRRPFCVKAQFILEKFDMPNTADTCTKTKLSLMIHGNTSISIVGIRNRN